ncbi:MAG TPA: hypothetical protein VMA77_06515 [Solirubrobacteraceae bacterium]|nr:hypothetical protein [Solirubrobacteraceae bacterium]
MNTQLNYKIAELRSAELQRAGERGRRPREAHSEPRKLPDPNLMTPASARRGRRSPRAVTVAEGKPATGNER